MDKGGVNKAKGAKGKGGKGKKGTGWAREVRPATSGVAVVRTPRPSPSPWFVFEPDPVPTMPVASGQ